MCVRACAVSYIIYPYFQLTCVLVYRYIHTYVYVLHLHCLCTLTPMYIRTYYVCPYIRRYIQYNVLSPSKYSLSNLDYANIYNFSGSRPSSSSILTEVQELLKAEDELQEKKVQLSQTEQQLEAVQRVATKWVPACMYL